MQPRAISASRRAKTIRSEMQRAREEIAQLRGATEGRVSVCLAAVPHTALLPSALIAFRMRYPDVCLNIIEGRFPRAEAALRDGTIDCYVGPPARESPGKEFIVEKLFDQTFKVFCRKGHPLAHARSVRELAGAEWVTHSLTFKAEDEYGPEFVEHGLSQPRYMLQAHSALTVLVAVGYSDLLAMMPAAAANDPFTQTLLQTIDIVERLRAPPICMIRRAGLPLTPAAEYFCDMMRRAAAGLSKPPQKQTSPRARPRAK